MANQWYIVEEYSDWASAEALRVMLEAEDVPAMVRGAASVGMVARTFQVLVDPSLERQVKQIRAQSEFSDAELEELATGEPPPKRR